MVVMRIQSKHESNLGATKPIHVKFRLWICLQRFDALINFGYAVHDDFSGSKHELNLGATKQIR